MPMALGTAVADAVGNSTLFDAARTLTDLVDNLRTNKETAHQLVRRVNELACTIINAADETSGDHTSYLQEFRGSLDAVASCLGKQSKQSFFSQLLYQERNKAQLKGLAEDVEIAYKKFIAQMRIEISDSLTTSMRRVDASAVLAQVTAAESTLREQSSLHGPSYAARHLPPAPQIFFGRDMERSAIIGKLVDAGQTQSHIAILGGPGMGKTSLALSCLHDACTSLRFGKNRFFVPCDAATPLVSIIAGSFGSTSSDPDELRNDLAVILGDTPSLLVLDNFESAWEPATSRPHAERVLESLSSLPNVSLILTMRGAERPQGVPWARPFLPVLQPLENVAASLTFLSLCNPVDSDAAVQQLLAHLGNLPLAVVLMASLAQYESVGTLLSRWTEMSTSMLRRSGGKNRLNSLDVSLAISLDSPRMRRVPDAVQLLSLLALLPRGALEPDMEVWASKFSPSALSTLRQNALVIGEAGKRLRVLAPLRDFILKTHPPSDEVAQALYSHYFAWGTALGEGRAGGVVAGALAGVVEEVENLESVIAYAIQHQEDPRAALSATVGMCSLYSYTGIRSAGLLTTALSVARRKHLTDHMANLSYRWSIACWNTDMPGDAVPLMEDAKRLYDISGNLTGAAEASMQLLTTLPPGKAAEEGRRILAFFNEQGDTRRSAHCCREVALAYERGGQMCVAREFYSRAVGILRATHAAEDPLLGYCLLQVATCDTYLCDISSALTVLPEAIRILTAAGAFQAISEAEHLLGDISLLRADGMGAVEHFQRSVAAQEGFRSRFDSMFTHSLVVAHLSVGNENGAIAALDMAEQSLHDDPESSQRRWLLHARGELALWRGDTTEAHALFMAVRHIMQVMNQPSQAADAHNVPEELLGNEAELVDCMGELYIMEERLEDAFSAFLVAALTWAKLSRTINTMSSVARLADAAPDDVASVLLEAIIPCLRRCGLRRPLAGALFRSAQIKQRCGDFGAAETLARESATIFEGVRGDFGFKKVEQFCASFL